MEIILKSNRKALLKLSITFVVILTICVIGCVLGYVLDKESTSDSLIGLCFCSVVDFGYIIALLILIFKKKPTYIFEEDKISYNKKGKVTVIKLEDVSSMIYYFAGFSDYIASLNPVISMKIRHPSKNLVVTDKNGKSHNLGFFEKKDVEKLKEIYGEMIQVNKGLF